jgi:hypothetical protein
MPSVVIVEKNGDLKMQEYKSMNTDELYKKCNFKKAEGFDKVTEWGYSKKGDSPITVELWARSDGQANQENKYDFPPPVDSDLFFGNCALLLRDSNMKIIDLTIDKWNKIYEHLFGGFETLADNADDDEEEEDELENVPSSMKTKDGYLKDGFIIEDALEDADVVDADADADADAADENESSGNDSEDECSSERDEDTTSSDEEEEDGDESGNDSDDSSELNSEEYNYSEGNQGSP